MVALPRFPAPLPPSVAAAALLPLSVVAGGALFWPAACLVAILAALERQHFAMLVWFGLAVGFDPQALLLAPFILVVLIGRRVAWPLLPVAPLFAAAMLLARPGGFAPNLMLPQDFALSGGAPNLWAIAQTLPWVGALPLTGLALTTALGAAAAYIAWFSARPLRRNSLLDAALLCALSLPALLPALDARAFLLADVLALAVAVRDPRPARWRIAALVLGGSLVAGLDLVPLGAVAMLLATLLHARATLRPAANDNPLMPRTA